MLDAQAAARKLTIHGQEHVLSGIEGLDNQARDRLLAQVETLDLDWLRRVFEARPAGVNPEDVRPFEGVILADDPRSVEARAMGEAALHAGRVGTLLVAGGQGTRLGFDGPKGAYPVGAVSGRTLFQIHAENLVAIGRKHGVTPPLYLMTSPANHQETLEIFNSHDYFGLPRDGVLIFPQGLAPAVDQAGKLLMDAPDHIVMTPNGNGGLFAALQQGGALAHMKDRGVDVVSYIQVDNPLAAGGDPLFIGHHLLRGSHYSCKAIKKVGPEEKVGSFALVKGRLRVVEYTEIPAALAHQTDAQGELLFSYSNPGLFAWSREFLEHQAAREDLPFHKAHKKILHLDPSGRLIKPVTPCGYKFEAFAMDTLPDAEPSLVMACDRDAEFAPVKNKEGVDSPASAQALMTRCFKAWIEAAGGRVDNEQARLEISPLYALDAEELAAKLPAGFTVTADLYLSV